MSGDMLVFIEALMRLIMILIFIATIVVALSGVGHYPRSQKAFMPIVIWSFIGLVFYVFVFGHRLDSRTTSFIETSYRLLSVIMVFGATFSGYMILREQNNRDE